MPDALGGATGPRADLGSVGRRDRAGASRSPTNPVVLSWRQYRLERRMFWRNPSAAFFNFVLPLVILAGAGAALSGNQHQLDRLAPVIAGMSGMSTTFPPRAYNIVFLRGRG